MADAVLVRNTWGTRRLPRLARAARGSPCPSHAKGDGHTLTHINPIGHCPSLLLGGPAGPTAAAYTIFGSRRTEIVVRAGARQIAYRHSQAAKPFNHKLKWLGTDVAAWETVESRRWLHSTPRPAAPGSMQQFHETVSFSTPACSIGATDVECYIIDGIERGRIAIL